MSVRDLALEAVASYWGLTAVPPGALEAKEGRVAALLLIAGAAGLALAVLASCGLARDLSAVMLVSSFGPVPLSSWVDGSVWPSASFFLSLMHNSRDLPGLLSMI